MGCDIFWNAKEPDIQKQRQCSLFLHAFFETQKWDYDIYNNKTKGLFLRLDGQEEMPPHTLDLLGVSSYLYSKENMKVFPDTAERQLSFVFDNTPTLSNSQRNALITVERINDFNIPKYQSYKESFKPFSENKDIEFFGMYRTGGYDRVIDYAFNIIVLFYLVKSMFIPALNVGDDYSTWDSVNNWTNEKGYNKALLSPLEKWQAIEDITATCFKYKFQKQHITTELKSFWNVDI